MPKGDGLVTYLKEPSVELAIQLLDGTPFRHGMQVQQCILWDTRDWARCGVALADPVDRSTSNLCASTVRLQKTMSVTPAQFELKGEAYKPKQSAGVRKKKKKVLETLEKKALSWEGFDDKVRPTQVGSRSG